MSQSNLLLDTHVILWFVAGHERLSLKAQNAINDARKSKTLYVSGASLWEIGCLQAKGKIDIGPDLPSFWLDVQRVLKSKELLFGRAVIFEFFKLDGMHNDPSDRFITATAIKEELTLVTADGKILEWAAAHPNRVSTLDARS